MKQIKLPFYSLTLLISLTLAVMVFAYNTLRTQKEDDRLERSSNNLVIEKQEGQAVDDAEVLFKKGFDKEQKRRDVINLVNKANTYFDNNSLTDACHNFTHNNDFFLGELYVFLIDMDGFMYAYGHHFGPIWHNFIDKQDRFGKKYIADLIDKGKTGDGWVTHEYRDSMKNTYIKVVEKDGKSFILGSGYYSHSRNDTVIGLVKGAVSFFNKGLKEKRTPFDLFSSFSYPLSKKFIVGDLYLYALDFEGKIVAQGDRPGLIGSNSLEYQDSEGMYINKEIIKRLQATSEDSGIWIEYMSKGAPKQVYAEKVKDSEGKEYFIACGYYPTATEGKAMELVAKGYQYMKSHGVLSAAREFSTRRSNTFRYGDLYLFVYDLQGNVIAHGLNEEWLGKNFLDKTDDEGDQYIRELINRIEKSDSQSVWVNHRIKHAFQSIYAEKITTGTKDYIIGCGIYPISKRETMMLLAKSAKEYLEENSLEEACLAFATIGGAYVRGDLFVFVLDEDGMCYVWGDDPEKIWQNLSSWQDDEGRDFINQAVNAVEHGPTKIMFTLHKRSAVAHVERVTKNGVNFIIGSYFYT